MLIKHVKKPNIMEKIVNKNYMYNLELQSLHYWFKNSPSQNPSNKYNSIFKSMQNAINKTDISSIIGTDTQQFTNFIQRPHVTFHDRVILKNVFEHWKIYVVHKLHTRRATYKADYFYRKRLQRKVLNALSKNVLLKWEHIVSSMDECTNRSVAPLIAKKEHYSKILLRKCFKRWCNYIAMINKKKELLGKAIQFYNLYRLKESIINWKMYVMLRRQKKHKIDEARKFYAQKILQKFTKAWINICEFVLQKHKIERAVMYHKNKLLVKYFSAWKTYHGYKIKKKNVEERVLMYDRKKLLKRYFELFIVYVNESIADKTANENAEIFYNSKLVQKVFFAWRGWYDKKIQNAFRISEIKNILEVKIKRITFNNWCLYVIRKKCGRRKTFAAQSFYQRKLAIKALRKFYNYTVYKKEKRIKLSHLNDKSEEIIQQLQIVCIEKWREALYSTVQEKQKLNQAIKLCELNLIRKYFFTWKEYSRRYRIKMVRKEKLNEIASSFLLKRFILHWHSKLQRVLDEREKEILAISAMENKITRKCFLSWKEYMARKVKMNNDIEAAMELHKKFLLREGLEEMLRNSLRDIDYQRDVQLKNAAMRSLKHFEILKEYFDKWHSLIYLKNKSELGRRVGNSNEFELTQTQYSRNDIFDGFKTRLVLPEYMMEKNSVSNVYEQFATLPQKNWSFN